MVDGTFATEEKKLYIGNMDQRMTEFALIKLLEPFGKIVSEQFVWNTETGQKYGLPRGFAFVELETSEQAQQAIRALNGKKVGEKELVVRLAFQRIETNDKKGGVNDTTQDDAALAAANAAAAHGRPGSAKARRRAVMAAIRKQLAAMKGEQSSSSANTTTATTTTTTTTTTPADTNSDSKKRKVDADNNTGGDVVKRKT